MKGDSWRSLDRNENGTISTSDERIPSIKMNVRSDPYFTMSFPRV